MKAELGDRCETGQAVSTVTRHLFYLMLLAWCVKPEGCRSSRAEIREFSFA